jgi:hypothetical protein
MKSFRYLCVAAIFCLSLVGCSTTSGVLVNHAAAQTAYSTVYVVVHGGASADMDALVQKELLRHDLNVLSGSDGAAPASAQLIVKYADDWKWDLKMYLSTLDIMAFDAKSGVLLATGSWKNSTFHGYYSEDKVVSNVMTQTLTGIGLK